MEHQNDIADIFETALTQKLSGVAESKKTVDDTGFSFDVTIKGTISQADADALIAETQEAIKKEGLEAYLMLKNVSGVHTDDTLPEGVTIVRVEVLCFASEADRKRYVEERKMMEERDHRKIGNELGLWTFSKLVGSGLPLFTPKGTAIRRALQTELSRISKKYGAQEVSIPHIAKKDLYDVSGHSEKFGDELLKVISKYDEFVMKPVNCPHHTQIYASEIRSYRDLPIRYIETTAQYRDEKPGEIGGLTRVRAINLDDGHTFCMTSQIQDEAGSIVETIRQFYTGLGLWGNHWVSLSVRDPNNKEGYIGEDADWDTAEQMLQEVSDTLSLDAKRCEGEAAIYGPKLDFMFRDSLGREQQLATVQIDFALPKRFGLFYIDKDGEKKTPVMIHRAILGSFERFMALLLEHFAGWLPLWLAPTQVAVIPVGSTHNEHAQQLSKEFFANDVRVEVFDADETLGKKIQKTKTMRIPHIIVVGKKEADAGVYVLQDNKSGDTILEGNKEELLNHITHSR